MTQVVTISATTAAYAAEAVKPSARLRGDGPADEAITLLSVRRQDQPASALTSIQKIKSDLPLHLLLIGAERRPPQETEAETLRRYLENMQDDESNHRQDRRQEEPAGDEQGDEIAEMLDRFIQAT